MHSNLRSGTLPVLPGDRIAVIEEFLPGPGTYEESGVIYSNFAGVAKLDPKNRKVSVFPLTALDKIPREGSVVLAVVMHVQEKIASVNIWTIDGKRLENPFTGVLHISLSSPHFEKDMSHVCKTGDIIRAKVIDMSNSIPKLGTREHTLGVVWSSCSRCGGRLEPTGSRLHCTVCKNVEYRKVAQGYGRLT